MNIVIFSPGAYAKYGHSFDYCKGLAMACSSQNIDVTIYGYDGPLKFESPINEYRIYGTGLDNRDPSLLTKILWGINRVTSSKQFVGDFLEYINSKNKNTLVLFETFEYLSLAYFSKKFKHPFCCIFHDTNFNFKQSSLIAGIYKFLCRAAVKKIIARAEMSFVHGEGMKTNLLEQLNESLQPKISVIPYGAMDPIASNSNEISGYKKELGLNPNKKHLLSFGTLRKDKNYDEIFDVLVKKPNWEWILAGPEGDLKYEEIERLGYQYNVRDRIIIFNRFIQSHEQKQYFFASEIVVNLYKDYIRHESGTAQLARAYVKPLAVSGPPDLTGYVEKYGIGWIVNENQNLSQILQKYTSMDLIQKKALNNNIINLAKKNSWSTVLSQMLTSINFDMNQNN